MTAAHTVADSRAGVIHYDGEYTGMDACRYPVSGASSLITVLPVVAWRRIQTVEGP